MLSPILTVSAGAEGQNGEITDRKRTVEQKILELRENMEVA
jgi:hypothetical protein